MKIFQILLQIFQNLDIGDLVEISLVCNLWYNLAALVLIEKVVVVIGDDFSAAIDVLSNEAPKFKYWVLKVLIFCYDILYSYLLIIFSGC